MPTPPPSIIELAGDQVAVLLPEPSRPGRRNAETLAAITDADTTGAVAANDALSRAGRRGVER